MNPNLPIDHLLDEYLQGAVSKEALKNQFPQLEEAALDKEIEMHRAATIFLEKAPILYQVKQIHEQFLKETIATNKISSIRNRKLAIITGIAAMLILAIGLFFLQSYSVTSADKFYSKVYQPYEQPVFRSAQHPSALAEYYAENKFRQAIEVYQTLKQPGQQDIFLAGMSYMQEKNWTAATSAFELIRTSNKADAVPLFQDEAEFYGALSYLKSGKKEEALKLLNIIHNDQEHLYHQQFSGDQLDRLTNFLRK